MEIDWENVEPTKITGEILLSASEENFPETYSGISWLAARRILLVLCSYVEAIRKLDPWAPDPRVMGAIEDLDMTGVLVGWVMSVLREMYGFTPGKSGAVIEIVKGNEDP